MPRLQIAVFGEGDLAGDPRGERLADLAYGVGRGLGRAGAVLVCGGRGGVMEAACRGARDAGGETLGILPGDRRAGPAPNPHLTHEVYAGVGQGRNLAVALSGRAAIAVGGSWGTLSEIALALRHGVPVVTLASWAPERPDGWPEPGLHRAQDADGAVRLALDLATAEP